MALRDESDKTLGTESDRSFPFGNKNTILKKIIKNAVPSPSVQSNELQLPTSISFGHLFDSDSASNNFIMTS